MKQYAFDIFGFVIKKETEIVVYAPEYLGKLEDIVRNTSNRCAVLCLK